MSSSPWETARLWVLASRPKTLVASLIPVCAGASLAYENTAELPMVLLVLALLFSLLIQIGTNFSNDYFDDLRGADRNRALGPSRLVSSGAIQGKTMIRASFSILVLAFVTGVVLMEVSGASRQLLWVGALSVIFVLGTQEDLSPWPTSLGDLFVVYFWVRRRRLYSLCPCRRSWRRMGAQLGCGSGHRPCHQQPSGRK